MFFPIFTPSNWYWTVAGHDGFVFSSAAADFVPFTDINYISWIADGGVAAAIASEDDLADTLEQIAPDVVPQFPAGLVAYAKRKQQALANGGVTVNVAASGSPVLIFCATDSKAKANLAGLLLLAQVDSAITVEWINGTTATSLTAAHIATMGVLVHRFDQATYTALAAVLVGIAATTITTQAQIDAAAWPPRS